MIADCYTAFFLAPDSISSKKKQKQQPLFKLYVN